MSTERPPASERDETEPDRRRLERILPEVIKRILEAGYVKLAEGPENVREFVREMKLPKEVLALILGQLDETKNGLYRVVAKEIRGFLQQNNLGEEIARALSHLSVEIKTEIRFVPTESEAKSERLGTPEVRSSVQIKSSRPDKS